MQDPRTARRRTHSMHNMRVRHILLLFRGLDLTTQDGSISLTSEHFMIVNMFQVSTRDRMASTIMFESRSELHCSTVARNIHVRIHFRHSLLSLFSSIDWTVQSRSPALHRSVVVSVLIEATQPTLGTDLTEVSAVAFSHCGLLLGAVSSVYFLGCTLGASNFASSRRWVCWQF